MHTLSYSQASFCTIWEAECRIKECKRNQNASRKPDAKGKADTTETERVKQKKTNKAKLTKRVKCAVYDNVHAFATREREIKRH